MDISIGMKVDNKDNNDTNLYKACQEGNVAKLKELLKKSENIDINAHHENGSTCLHGVVIHNCQYLEMVSLLLEHGASVNIKDNDGNTPLHSAVLFHCKENIKEIIKYNPDITIENKDGVTAVDFAKNVDDTELESLLTGKEVKKRKRKLRQGSTVVRSVNKKIKSFLPVTPIMSPSILRKRRRIKNNVDEDIQHSNKRSCVKFDIPEQDTALNVSS